MRRRSDCLSATLPATSVPAKGRAEMRFACPVSHPNLWGWDAAQHEHIFVQMVDVDQWTVTIEGVNSSTVPGDFVVSLGCSDQPYAGSGIQKSRQLAPTAQLSKRKPSRTSRGHLSEPGDVGDSACDGVPDCQPQPQPTFAMGGWESTTKSQIPPAKPGACHGERLKGAHTPLAAEAAHPISSFIWS